MTLLLSLLLIQVGCSGHHDDDETKQVLVKLQGTWKVESSIQGGEPVPTKDDVKWIYTIKGEELLATNDPKYVVKFKLDPRQKLAAIDLEDQKDQKTSLGIYQIASDALKLCFNQPGEPRPTVFTSAKGSRTILFVLKREKK